MYFWFCSYTEKQRHSLCVKSFSATHCTFKCQSVFGFHKSISAQQTTAKATGRSFVETAGHATVLLPTASGDETQVCTSWVIAVIRLLHAGWPALAWGLKGGLITTGERG